MKSFLHRLIKIAAYSAAGLVILLAIAVGLFRLFLPRLPEYQEEIKTWASSAVGMQVEFTGMDARWGLRGPELKFYDAELIRPDNQSRTVAAEEVGVGVSLVRLLVDRTLIVDTVTVRNTSVEVRELADGSWRIQGSQLDDLIPDEGGGASGIGAIEIIAEDIKLLLIRSDDERPTVFEIPTAVMQRDDFRLAINADVRLPEPIGNELTLSAVQRKTADGQVAPWNVTIEADEINLAGVSSQWRSSFRQFGSGHGDVEVSLAVVDRTVVSATADVALQSVTMGNGPVFDISGRLAFNNDASGWLVAADDLALATPNGAWPKSAMRFETSTDSDRNIVMFDARASYLNLADIDVVMPWLEDAQQETLRQLSPAGVTRNLISTGSDLDSESPRYTVSVELEDVGVAASGKMPGVHGFSGGLRADSDGGSLEINTTDMTLDLGELYSSPIGIDVADGIVIWRRSNERLTILSHNIAIQNAILDSENNVEILIEGDNAPVVDLVSNWSISDLAAAKAYIPESLVKPRLYQWFQDAIVSGRMPRGSTRLHGPIDKFPFDGDEGQLLIEATIQNMTFQYLPQFPVAKVSEMDIVLENARLYTNKNRSLNRGNSVVDAKVEIADLRKPVLRIDSYSTGTLESLRGFSANSPIGSVFGGQLDRVSVSGDAAVTLDLTIPLLDWRSFEFTSRLTTSNGTLAVEGLRPPITELSGAVTIERDLVSSESLGGLFLGEPVSIELHNAPADMPEYRVVASANGSATPSGLVDELGLPLTGKLAGRTNYHADVLFPRAGAETPGPLTVKVESDLTGLAVDLPLPLGKLAAASRPLVGELQFFDADRIRSHGRASNEFSWQLEFAKVDQNWDFDRGILSFGDEEMADPDVRGLHIRGRASEVRLEDWLALSRGEDVAKTGAAERIRSIDVAIDDLYLLGQHLVDHRVRVDRSARDWLVQFEGALVDGSVFVPYVFSADRTLVLDMQRLILPGDESDESGDAVDPRTLPAISLRAAEFALGERYFGAVETEFARTPAGLVTDSIVARDKSFEIVGNASWLVDETDPMGYRSAMTATLTSTDVEQTMRRLNYQAGIVSKDMGMLLDISWSGGPRLDFLDTLDGEVAVRLGAGQLNAVDPGAGRMFGLMSIVALPRRLSLDFRDVFKKGFGFDKISGNFRIDDGEAYTCNLSLEGPAADIGILGRANLAKRDYEQTAVVSPKVGNTLPVIGGLVAGPQAAAALLIFSQIFKRPLKDIGEAYYGVSGSWDNPAIDSVDGAALDASGRLAGCIPETR